MASYLLGHCGKRNGAAKQPSALSHALCNFGCITLIFSIETNVVMTGKVPSPQNHRPCSTLARTPTAEVYRAIFAAFIEINRNKA
jgi:hypothetical protein